LNLGTTNIDHLLLTGAGWAMIDAKGCGAGTLQTNERGKGILVDPAGKIRPQPWMDDAHSYSRAGIPYRLTEGKPGWLVWVLPETIQYDRSVLKARFIQRTGSVLTIDELESV
ncbi:MAG TPA: hypothetical protein VE197_11830, partial [Mycobacterium sp.]|nr:hypothetical protein [Mycobacterium sp.]